ncbi:RsmB/NOP family class I SAM-dependent RNA methyltransferase [Candidatus Woesearchaeota archaeon]|nr:RsmB/NOP family class I SAM-dependent RNA methyltransferase [Candidatus Woesearchaeota archaeon]
MDSDNEKERSHFDKWVDLKPEFIKRYTDLLGEEGFNCFNDYSNRYIRKSIRVNTLKISVKDLKKRLEPEWNLEQIPWCKEGFWITYRQGKRFDIGNLPEHQLGYIYVQDAASMLPPVVLKPEPGALLLDTCAAPGSKTSQAAAYMKNTGLIIANDMQGKRLSSLGINLQRCGVHNTIITKMDGTRILKQGEGFDFVMVDAPCSGTGTIRRNPKISSMWSPGLVKRMVRDQRKLAFHGFKLLKPGGVMVYSTCTLEPEENEGIVSDLLDMFENAELLDITLDINRSPVVVEFDGRVYNSEVYKCLRIYPQDNDSEGFFVAKIRKKI